MSEYLTLGRRGIISTWIFLALLTIFIPVFYIFSYNSGYGFDALEYLTIAKYLATRYDLYAFIPSKSWAMYAYTNFWLSAFGFNHYTVSALITFDATLMLVLAYWVTARTFSPCTASIASGIIAFTCFFTEMNFLEPEILVGTLGLCGFYFAAIASPDTYFRWFLSGLLVGLGVCIKAVATFYLVGVVAFLLCKWFVRTISVTHLLTISGWLLAGFLLPPVISIIAFSRIGQLQQHLEWTYVFSLFHYPSNTYWLSKFFLKLFWFHSMLACCAILSLRKHMRGEVYSERMILVLCLAGFSLLALLKTQASHYFFPSAIFFSIFIAAVVEGLLNLRKFAFSIGTIAAFYFCLSLAGSWVVLYRKDALERFYSFRDYSEERVWANFLNDRVPRGNHFLSLSPGGTLFYYVTGRFPNVPFINTEVQTTYFLSKHPQMIEKALDAKTLRLVIFDENNLRFDDPAFMNNSIVRMSVERSVEKLKKLYRPEVDPRFPYKVWIRQEGKL